MYIHNFYRSNYEDWFGVCSIGLCKAARTFDPTKEAQFSTYAYACMENEVKMQKRYFATHLIPTISLDDNIEGTDGLKFESILSTEEEGYDKIPSENIREVIDSVYGMLKKRDVEICKMILEQNMTFESVGKMFGISKQYVSIVYRRFLHILRQSLILNNVTTPTGELL